MAWPCSIDSAPASPAHGGESRMLKLNWSAPLLLGACKPAGQFGDIRLKPAPEGLRERWMDPWNPSSSPTNQHQHQFCSNDGPGTCVSQPRL